MKVAFFVHAIASCWNNGNAHFLRGVATSLQRKGHEVIVYEPRPAWSRDNLLAAHGPQALRGFESAFPPLRPRFYEPAARDPEPLTGDADLAIAHARERRGLS